MAYFSTSINDSPVIAVKAASDITSDFLAVELTADGIKLPTAAGIAAIGLLIPGQEIKSGDTATVQIKDMGKWTTGAAVAIGDPLATDTSGKCVKAAEGAFILGYALEAATAADAVIAVQITKSGYVPASA